MMSLHEYNTADSVLILANYRYGFLTNYNKKDNTTLHQTAIFRNLEMLIKNQINEFW